MGLFAESAVSHDYEYLDSGNQRRLERFGTRWLCVHVHLRLECGLARSARGKLRWCTRMENKERRYLPRKDDGSGDLD